MHATHLPIPTQRLPWRASAPPGPAWDWAATTAQALTEDGDARITLNSAGTNAYGCPARPDPLLLALGSSTASVVSEAGFAAAMALHARLRAHPERHAAEARRLRHELLALSGGAQVPGTQLVLGASGTDLHLIATQLAATDNRRPLQALMAEPSETGSGLPAALSVQHFGSRTCQGQAVLLGAPLDGTPLHAPAAVALRHADGRPRSSADVDAEFAAQAERIVHSGGRCLLVLTDLSKTGLLAPSLACALRLRAHLGPHLEVLVDACQYRLAPESVAAYLQHGCMLALTGSKFLTGPAFCGALLLPAALARRCQGRSLQSLRPYSSRSDWPEHWPAAAALHQRHNTGLLLRWEAALSELRRFRAVPTAAIDQLLADWGQAVAARIASEAHLSALPVPALRRLGTPGAPAWDRRQTIFPFTVQQRSAAGVWRPLSREATTTLHQALQMSDWPTGLQTAEPTPAVQRCQLGQPVQCGNQQGVPVSALRMCASARLVADMASKPDGSRYAIAQAMLAFDKLRLLVRRLETDA